MFERFNTEVRAVVFSAAQEATVRRGEGRVGSDHLLIGVVATGNHAAEQAGLSVDGLHEALDRLDARALGAVGLDAANLALSRPWGWAGRGHLPFTRGAKNALHRTLRIAIDLGHRQISSDHLLAGLTVGGPKDPAVRLLRACSVEPAELESAVRRRLHPQAS
ncbi:MAG TPA: Clp protease N-terminal domain-containing protein [Acidimicrobiia bacterium]|nr:Clp protease N-terminal domain-containing protein [Acidimicrobiia bacterium]